MAGSFARKEDILSSIQAKKGQQDPSQAEKRPTGPSTEQILKEQADIVSNLIDKQLPETVNTAFGTVEYAKFKQIFSDVYEQVADKHNLIIGRVSHAFKVGSMVVTVRSLKNKERVALMAFVGNPKTEDLAKFSRDDAEYRKRFLVASLVSIDETRFPDVLLSSDNLEKWEQNQQIKEAMNFIEDLDDSLVVLLFNLAMDLSMAKQLALIENLKNQ
jgi:hypothetical protein